MGSRAIIGLLLFLLMIFGCKADNWVVAGAAWTSGVTWNTKILGILVKANTKKAFSRESLSGSASSFFTSGRDAEMAYMGRTD